MESNYVKIGNMELLAGAVLMLIPILLSHIQKTGLEKDFLIGGIRSFIQLMAVGYILKAIFGAREWYWVIIAISVMILVAGFDAVRREEKKVPLTYPIAVIGIGTGAFLVMALALLLTLRIDSWYNPQYVIPMMGRLIGNSMNGASLLINRLRAEIRNHRDLIETKLSLGAGIRESLDGIIQSAVRASLIPTINTLMIIGLVSLPGMMTGQIIAGADPLDSVRYQLIIVYMIAGCSSIAVFITSILSYRQFFTKDLQLKEELL